MSRPQESFDLCGVEAAVAHGFAVEQQHRDFVVETGLERRIAVDIDQFDDHVAAGRELLQLGQHFLAQFAAGTRQQGKARRHGSAAASKRSIAGRTKVVALARALGTGGGGVGFRLDRSGDELHRLRGYLTHRSHLVTPHCRRERECGTDA